MCYDTFAIQEYNAGHCHIKSLKFTIELHLSGKKSSILTVQFGPAFSYKSMLIRLTVQVYIFHGKV